MKVENNPVIYRMVFQHNLDITVVAYFKGLASKKNKNMFQHKNVNNAFNSFVETMRPSGRCQTNIL